MRLISILILFVLPAFCISCKKESDKSPEETINNTSKIYGVVKDEVNRAIIPAVTIELKKENGVISSTTSNDSGSYCFTGVASGSYFMHFYKSGCYFHDSIQINVNADINTDYEINSFLYAAATAITADSINRICDSAAIAHISLDSFALQNATTYGLCWDSVAGVDMNKKHIEVKTMPTSASLSMPVTRLKPSTIYYLRAYVQIAGAYYFSNEISFLTSATSIVAVNSALLVIDMQNAIFPIINQSTIIANINSLIQKAKVKNAPVIFFQFNDNYSFQNGTGGWMIYSAINYTIGDEVIQKYYQNSFTSTNLKQRLDNAQITKLYIAGLQSQYCEKTTCMGALNYNYDVVLVKDAHSTSTSSGNTNTINTIN